MTLPLRASSEDPMPSQSGSAVAADPGPPERIEVYDERFGRRVGVTFQLRDPDRLLLYVDGAGGYVVSATAFRALMVAVAERS